MKKISFLILLVIVLFNAKAQITIINADMPRANDTVRVSLSTTNMDVRFTGANYNWNFANINIVSQEVIKYQGPFTTPYALYFSGATYGLPEANAAIGAVLLQDPYGFYRNSATAQVFMGRGASVQGLPIGINYSPRDTIYRFPLTFGRKDSSNYAGSVDLATLGSLKIGGKRVVEVDGWGSITTPAGTYNCIRVKSTITEIDTLVFGGFPIPVPNNRIEYKWLAKGLKFPVLEVVVTSGITGSQTTRFLDIYRPELYVNNTRFTANKTITQIGDTINIIDQSINNPLTWQYTITPNTFRFVGGTNASSQNPRVIFDANGQYSVKLTATFSGGMDDTMRTNYITVQNGVIANFGSDKTITNPTTVVSFYDSCVGNPTSYLWSFNPNTVSFVGGTLATSANPKVVFNNIGNYSVTLKATNSIGSNSITKTNYIVVWATGINDISKIGQINAMPNPANNFIEISGSKNLTKMQISVYDLLGKQQNVNFSQTDLNTLNANISELPNGIYFIKIGNETESICKKFIKE